MISPGLGPATGAGGWSRPTAGFSRGGPCSCRCRGMPRARRDRRDGPERSGRGALPSPPPRPEAHRTALGLGLQDVEPKSQARIRRERRNRRQAWTEFWYSGVSRGFTVGAVVLAVGVVVLITVLVPIGLVGGAIAFATSAAPGQTPKGFASPPPNNPSPSALVDARCPQCLAAEETASRKADAPPSRVMHHISTLLHRPAR